MRTAARPLNAYAEAETDVDRRRLIVDNIPLVKYVLGRLAVHFPAHVDRDDLMEAGVLGLIDAAQKFDASRKVQFRTYAISRIRGSIIDDMRRLDWLPRSLRDEVSRLESTREKLRQRLNRPPTMAELAKELDITPAKLDHIVSTSDTESIYSLEDTRRTSAGGGELSHAIPAREDRYTQPHGRVEFEEQKSILAEAIGRLSENERLVITLYYYEDMLLREIGELMGLSDSRVCQVHRAALARLRRALRPLLSDDAPAESDSPDADARAKSALETVLKRAALRSA